MNIQIHKFKTITELLLYTFDYNEYSNTFTYSGFQISRRNDIYDVWGHKWLKHFAKQKLKEEQEYEAKFDYYPDGYDYNPLDEGYNVIAKKYNPFLNKTNTGKPYLEGIASYNTKHLPVPEFTKEELLEQLKKAVAMKLKTATLRL